MHQPTVGRRHLILVPRHHLAAILARPTIGLIDKIEADIIQPEPLAGSAPPPGGLVSSGSRMLPVARETSAAGLKLKRGARSSFRLA